MQRPVRREIGSAPLFDACATTRRSLERDLQLQEWFGRPGSPLASKLADYRGGWTEFACFGRRPRSRERLVQGLTFVLRQIVPLVVDDQVKLSAIRQRRWLVEAQPPVLDTCTRRHVTTVRRQQAIGKPAVGQSSTARDLHGYWLRGIPEGVYASEPLVNLVPTDGTKARDPRSHLELGRFEIVNTAIRDGAVVMGFNPRETAIPEDVLIEVEALTPLAFDDAPARNKEVMSALNPLAGYVESIVIPSLNPWLV